MSSKTLIKSELELEYEVFLSFRGSDTRDKFTDHLYVNLMDRGIRVYRDNEELEKGENIGSGLLEGISRSKIAIPIFSKGYVESKWCLNELVKIMECKNTNELKVMPVFYDVAPSEVGNQTGDYGKIFEAHQNTYSEIIIDEWKKALTEVGKLSGWDIHGDASCRQEGQVVKKITNTVLCELKKAYMMVTDYLVGLEHHVGEILNTLNVEINGIKIVGIHGMGGMGKTTLAKVIHNHLLPHFESHCFLANIRETVRSKGMEFLQERLISDGIRTINERFYNKKVLLILDDVDEIDQLKSLMGKRDCYGSGSRIIITTRNKDTIDWVTVDQSYELSGLDSYQALQLFSRHAFRSDKPPEEYTNLSLRIVEIAAGLPLALEVFGSLLCGKSEEQWRYRLKKLEKVPRKEVSAKLRISFDALDDQQKHVFLDIACFFIGEDRRIAIYFWDDSEYPEEAIDVLQQMSLIKIEKGHSIWMHDQLRDLGREIVQQEHNCNRLWNEEQVEKLFATKMRSEYIRGINFNRNWSEEGNLFREDLSRLPNLKLLRAKSPYPDGHYYSYIRKWEFWEGPPVFSNLRWLSWTWFPYKVYRSNFSVENLVMLELSFCDIESDWGGWECIKTAKKLKVLTLEYCYRLVRTPDFSYHPLLERLILSESRSLVEIDESLGMLKHLQIIRLKGLPRVRKLPKQLSCTESLEELIIDDTSIVEIPKWPTMKRLRVLDIRSCYDLKKKRSLETLPESIGDFLSLTELHLSYSGIVVPSNIKLPQSLISLKVKCQDMQIPDLSSLTNLKILDLQMSKDGDYPFEAHDPAPWWIGRLTKLENLILSNGRITSLHADVGALFQLSELRLFDCDRLKSVPKLPPSLKDLTIHGCESLVSLLDLPSGLKSLHISSCGSLGTLLDLPSGITSLYINGCGSLGTLLDLPSGITSLSIYNCSSLGTLSDLPSGLKSLYISGCGSLGTLLDLPSGITSLSIYDCSSLGTLSDLPSGIRRISIFQCKTLTLVDICTCKSLQQLSIEECDLSEIDGLEVLEGLTTLTIRKCVNLQRLPDLSNLKMLKFLDVCFCPKLIGIPGRLKSLVELRILNCKSLERIPNIPKSESLGPNVYIHNCGKIEDVGTPNFKFFSTYPEVRCHHPREMYVHQISNSFRPIRRMVAALHRLFRNVLS